MPTCPHCGRDHAVEDLVRHEHVSLVVVHCPDCNQLMGSYRDPALRSR